MLWFRKLSVGVWRVSANSGEEEEEEVNIIVGIRMIDSSRKPLSVIG